MNYEKINLEPVDEHRVYRQEFCSFLSKYNDIAVAIESSNGCDLLHWLVKLYCIAVLPDLNR